MLAALTSAPYVSLHSADPGGSGTNELSGVARQLGALAAASGSSRALTVATTHSIGAGQTVAYVGLWDAATSGNFLGSFSVTSETYGGAGTYQVDPSSVSLS